MIVQHLKTAIEILLDGILDALLPLKLLSKTRFKDVTFPSWLRIDHVLNQKMMRLQLLARLQKAGIDRPQTVKVWWSRGLKNFGDELMGYLLAHIAGLDCVFDRKMRFIGIGSTARFARDRTLLWGSGIIRRDEVIRTQPQCLAVRGPLTRQTLFYNNIECPEVYGDPAMLFPLFYAPKLPKSVKTLIVPHFKHTNLMEQHADFDYADLQVRSITDIETIIDTIIKAPCVLTSSLHGFVFCVAYGIPVSVFQREDKAIGGDNIKFEDFCMGVGLEPITIHTLKSDDEKSLKALSDQAKIYTPNWSPLPLLQSLYDVYPTVTLAQFIETLTQRDLQQRAV